MINTLLPVGLVLLPVLVVVLLRVNAAFVFLSLCLGAVLVEFVGDDAVSIFTGASKHAQISAATIRLLLLILPAALTTLFMIGTVKKKQLIINTLAALGIGVLTALLVVPRLSPGLSHSIINSDLWRQIHVYQAGLVAASTLVCLIFLWMQRPRPGKRHRARAD